MGSKIIKSQSSKLPLAGGTMTGDINSADNTIGFTKHATSSGTNVTIDFRDGHKADLDMSSAITNLSLQFPAKSGNFILVIKQDGSARTITNYYALDSGGSNANNDGGTAGDVRWGGGQEPSLSGGSNRRDIVSFYWDATDEVCYGSVSLNFF